MKKAGNFFRTVKGNRGKPLVLDFPKAAARADKTGGDSLFESLDGEQEYIPYTDSDFYCDGSERPPQDFIDQLQDKVLENWCILVGPQGYDGCELKMATRHGLVTGKNVYKLSFRFYLRGFKVRPKVMGEYIKRKGLSEGKFGDFDPAPYGKTQLLGCVGFYKSEADRRVLEPYSDGSLESFMVQNLTGDERVLEYWGSDDEPEIGEVDLDQTDHSGCRYAPPWEVVERLIMALSVEKRCERETYKGWSEVGWALAGVARVAGRWKDGFRLWDRFCRQCPVAYDRSSAWTIYSYARSDGPQLGWKGLMEWLKEDDPAVHNELKRELASEGGEAIEDPEEQKVVRSFVNDCFSHNAKSVDKLVVMPYEQGRFLVAFLNERSCCQFIRDDHEDGTLNRIVIGLKAARDKCSHPSCKDKTNKVVEFAAYPDAVKAITRKYLVLVETPEEAVRKYVMERKETDFQGMDDGTVELGPLQELPFCNRYQLTKNTWCPVCRCKHDKPENCLLLNETAKMLTVGCRLDPDNFHPPKGLALPPSVTNVFIQNVTFNANTEQLDDEVFDEEFPVFDDKTLNRLVNSSLKGYASDIARVFVHLGRDLFGVQSGDKDTWWAWDEVEMRWMQSSHKANIFCDEVVASKYLSVIQWIRQNTLEDDKRARRLQKIDHLLKRLKDRDQHSILAQVAILLKEEKRAFETALDANKNLLNFRGQVFDFETLTLRDVLATDNVSRTTGYKLPDTDTEQQAFVMEFMRSIMPDSVHVDYLLTWLASCLDGWNREETFSILSGSGRNGKSLLRDLLASAFGEAPATGYFGVVSASLLTKERPSSDRPVADLLHMKGKRLLIASEPEKGARINCGFLKFLTGNDPINGRWLQSNAEISFQPQHSLALLCNNIPNLDANDEAVWDRSRVLKFPFKFVTRPTQDHHRKSDPFLKSKLPKMGPQLMLILLEYYRRYKTQGLEPTPQMLQATDTVREEDDIYGEFITEHYELTSSIDDHVVYKDLTEHCKAWKEGHAIYRDSKTFPFSRDDLKARMVRFTGDTDPKNHRPPNNKKLPTRKCWTYARRIEAEDASEETPNAECFLSDSDT